MHAGIRLYSAFIILQKFAFLLIYLCRSLVMHENVILDFQSVMSFLPSTRQHMRGGAVKSILHPQSPHPSRPLLADYLLS